MELLIDSANLEEIREIIKYYPIDGVTTNPTLVTQEKEGAVSLIKEIRSMIGDDKQLHVQVVAKDAEEMIRQAKFLTEEVDSHIYVKIPVTTEGIKAMKALKGAGIKITATTIYTHLQAIMATKAGADYLAPYVNRIENLSGNGVEVVAEIAHSLQLYGYDAKILGASFKNTAQVNDVMMAGAGAITAAPAIIQSMLKHPATETDAEVFIGQWTERFGTLSF